MARELMLRSGRLTIRRDRSGSALVLACEGHGTEQAIRLDWPNPAAVMCDFLDRHGDCREADWYNAPQLVADSNRPA